MSGPESDERRALVHAQLWFQEHTLPVPGGHKRSTLARFPRYRQNRQTTPFSGKCPVPFRRRLLCLPGGLNTASDLFNALREFGGCLRALATVWPDVCALRGKAALIGGPHSANETGPFGAARQPAQLAVAGVGAIPLTGQDGVSAVSRRGVWRPGGLARATRAGQTWPLLA